MAAQRLGQREEGGFGYCREREMQESERKAGFGLGYCVKRNEKRRKKKKKGK